MKIICLFLLLFCGFTLANNENPRVITPDWAIASALQSLERPPIAMGDKRIFPKWSHAPIMDQHIIDLGARHQPNRELLAQLDYDLILDNFFYQHLRSLYPKDKAAHDILFDQGNLDAQQHWQNYATSLKALGKLINAEQAVINYLEHAQHTLKTNGATIKNKRPDITSFVIIQFIDAKHFRLYAENSLFYVALQEMNLNMETLNHPQGNRWGMTTQKLSQLQHFPDNACLIIIAPFSPLTQKDLEKSYLWQRLGFAKKEKCVYTLPAVWIFGGIDALLNFSHFLTKALTEQ